MKGLIARHGRASGGKLEKEPAKEGWDADDKGASDVYAGSGSDVVKEARAKKRGGKVCRRSGGKVEGEHSRYRLDRKPRKSGGRVGSDKIPLSGAAKMSNRPGAKVDDIDD